MYFQIAKGKLDLKKIKGIVVKANQNIFLDKHEGLKFANKNRIFVIAK